MREAMFHFHFVLLAKSHEFDKVIYQMLLLMKLGNVCMEEN